jgi:nucleolar protein 58
MYLLFETPIGYALFKVDENRFTKVKTWQDLPQDSASVKKLVQLHAFKEFKDAKEVLQASVKLIHGKLSKTLDKFLRSNALSNDLNQQLMVNDKKIAAEISKSLNIKCVSNDKSLELTRVIRGFSDELFADYNKDDMKNMALGLAHGLGRFKIKFSADKVDTMIIQAVSLHGDLDKEINNYMMRLREWYGYHFPELAHIVTDNIVYTKIVKAVGNRSNCSGVELTELVGEDLERDIKTASDVSMGTDISESDQQFILGLADQILELDDYRSNLEEYLKNRMMNVAPNLSTLVGEIIAAKLIAKAGSLVNLAKFSASTIQIMGAEKALFKAMKTKKQTPKYGIIYQTKILSNANGRAKGKMARALASKSALCVRYDALAEDENNEISIEAREYLEKRMKYLEDVERNAGNKDQSKGKFIPKQGGNFQAAQGHNRGGDFAMGKRDGNFNRPHQDGQSGGFKKQKFQ